MPDEPQLLENPEYLRRLRSMLADEEWRRQVEQQHLQILTALRAMQEHTIASDNAMAHALTNMRDALLSTLKVPVAVAMIWAVTWLFYAGKVTEKTWMVFCFVSLFPWFGDSICMVFELFRGGNSARERDKTVAAAKLVALAAALVVLVLPSDWPSLDATAVAAQAPPFIVHRTIQPTQPNK